MTRKFSKRRSSQSWAPVTGLSLGLFSEKKKKKTLGGYRHRLNSSELTRMNLHFHPAKYRAVAQLSTSKQWRQPEYVQKGQHLFP